MYTPAPSEQELAVAGVTLADYESEAVGVWPENERAYFLFLDLQTQWRVGMGGATGLDYLVLFAKLDRMRLADEEAERLECDIRTMEFAALATMGAAE